jgi:thioredoxin-like negative regulator of GroEL
MSLDQYSLCPCGSGKKIKFCKCNEQLAEMQAIQRMIAGQQNVAALDRINSDLKTMPSEPWLLAMKCELLLQLGELESLEETSAKFIRLQPDNPLAKLHRSLVAIVRGNTEEGASLLIQSLADAGENVHPLTATVAMNLIDVLLKRGLPLPALLHTENLLDLGEMFQQVAVSAYQSILSNSEISTLLRETIPSPIDVGDAPYGERLDEAQALIDALRINGAKTKLEGMIREFGPQAAILQSLLPCQLLLTDVESAASTCRKLAQSTELPEHQRVYYQALAFELMPQSSGITLKDDLVVYTVEDPAFESKLTESKSLQSIGVDQLREMLQVLLEEEVPPKSAYVCVDPVLQEQFSEFEPLRAGSWVAFYGKQTDKPARLVTLEASTGYQKEQSDKLKIELGLSSLKRELVDTLHMPFLNRTNSPIMIRKEIPAERQLAVSDAFKQLNIDNALDIKLECLADRSMREAAGQSEYRVLLQAILLAWQSRNPNALFDSDFDAIHKRLQVSEPKLSSELDVFDLVGGAAYYWTDLANIDAQSLIQLMQSSLTRGVSSMYPALIDRAQSMQWPEELKGSAEYTIYNLRVRSSSDPNEAEKLLARIIETGKKLNLSVGGAIVERFELLNMLGRSTEARVFMESSLRENSSDPTLLRYIQALMQQSEMMARGRGGAGGPGANGGISDVGQSNAGNSGTGLWTPDGGDGPQDSSGGSKLWIPD